MAEVHIGTTVIAQNPLERKPLPTQSAGDGRSIHVWLTLLLPGLRHVLAGAGSTWAPAAPAGEVPALCVLQQ